MSSLEGILWIVKPKGRHPFCGFILRQAHFGFIHFESNRLSLVNRNRVLSPGCSDYTKVHVTGNDQGASGFRSISTAGLAACSSRLRLAGLSAHRLESQLSQKPPNWSLERSFWLWTASSCFLVLGYPLRKGRGSKRYFWGTALFGTVERRQ